MPGMVCVPVNMSMARMNQSERLDSSMVLTVGDASAGGGGVWSIPRMFTREKSMAVATGIEERPSA